MKAQVMTVAMLLSAQIGCRGGNVNSDGLPVVSQAVCDPLAPPPITLGTAVAVGRDAGGTLYVDAANGVFVSSDGALVRQHVVGGGQSGSDYFTYSFIAPGADVTTARDLIVETGANGVTMTLGPGGSGKQQLQTGATTGLMMLTVLPPSVVAGMPVVNTPNVISYVGDAANGDLLVATVPLNSPSGSGDDGVYDGGLSIFYGPPTTLAQRTITAFEETLSGNGTVTFLVDGTPYDLQFGEVAGPDAGPLGMFALLGLGPQGGQAMAITLRSPTPATPPPGLTFTCLP